MMRENESDSEDGWQQPDEDVIRWPPRDGREADRASGTGAFPPGTGDHETLASGQPGGDDGWGRYVPRAPVRI